MSDKRRLWGVIFFSVIFLFAGISQFFNVFTVYRSKMQMAPYLYKAGILQVSQLQMRVRAQAAMYSPEKKERVYAGLFGLKKQLNDYKYEFTAGSGFDIPLAVFIFMTVFSAMMFLLSGYHLLRLRAAGLRFLALTLLSGLLSGLSFLGEGIWQMRFVLEFQNKILNVLELMNDSPVRTVMRISDIYAFIFEGARGYFLALSLGGYALFSLLAVWYFQKEEVRNRFSGKI